MAGEPYDASLRRDGLVPIAEESQRVMAAWEKPTPAEEPPDERQRKQDLLARAMECWKLAEDAEGPQRARELEDLKFARGLTEDQWPAEIIALRQGGIIDGVAVPARPCLTIPRVKQPVQQITNEGTQARLGIIIKAKGDGATPEGAELRQGLIRAIETDSNAPQARNWAYDRCVKCGRGYYRVLTQYANDADFDLDIVIKPIRRQGTVYLDPSHEEFDASDMKWAFLISDLTGTEFKSRFGREPSGSDTFESVTDLPPTWQDSEYHRVAEFWYVETTPRELVYAPALAGVLGPDGQPVYEGGKAFRDELPAGWQDTPGTKTRTVYVRTVKCAIITGTEVLEEHDWPGRWIPILQVLGEVHDVDGKTTVVKGVVSDAKDAGRVYNYMTSSQVEQVGLAPRVPFVMAAGQQEGFEGMWSTSHARNYAYLLYNPIEHNGHLLPPPQRMPPGEMGIEAVMLARQSAEADIKATTGRFDPSLGVYSSERSGKAIRELKSQGELGSSHYLNNLATVTMRHEARILLDLLPKVYDRPGRIMRLLGDEEDDERQIILGQPFIEGPDGRPQPMSAPGGHGPMPMGPGGPMPGPQGMPGGEPPPKPKLYDLSAAGDYAVVISVGRAQQTQREQNLEVVQSMIEATKGAIAPLVADIWAEQLDGPLARRLAKRLKNANPQIAAAEKGDMQAIPPEAQAQMAQMQQQLQQLQQALAEATKAAEGHTIKAQADVAKTKMDVESRERIAGLETQAKMQEAALRIKVEDARLERELQNNLKILQVKAVIDKENREDTQAHDFALQQAKVQADAEVKRELARQQLDAQRETAGADLAFRREDSEKSRAHALTIEEKKAAAASQAKVRKVKRDERGLISEIEE